MTRLGRFPVVALDSRWLEWLGVPQGWDCNTLRRHLHLPSRLAVSQSRLHYLDSMVSFLHLTEPRAIL